MLHLSDDKKKKKKIAKHKKKTAKYILHGVCKYLCGSGFAGATSFVQEIHTY